MEWRTIKLMFKTCHRERRTSPISTFSGWFRWFMWTEFRMILAHLAHSLIYRICHLVSKHIFFIDLAVHFLSITILWCSHFVNTFMQHLRHFITMLLLFFLSFFLSLFFPLVLITFGIVPNAKDELLFLHKKRQAELCAQNSMITVNSGTIPHKLVTTI